MMLLLGGLGWGLALGGGVCANAIEPRTLPQGLGRLVEDGIGASSYLEFSSSGSEWRYSTRYFLGTQASAQTATTKRATLVPHCKCRDTHTHTTDPRVGFTPVQEGRTHSQLTCKNCG